MRNVIDAVTDGDFDATVLRSNTPVLVEFWSAWCEPCHQSQPIVNELAGEHADKLRFVRVDVDENPVIPSISGLTAIPTISVYVDGEVALSIVGVRSKAALLAQLAEFLA